eukprot:188483-Amphidinium_carterae.3
MAALPLVLRLLQLGRPWTPCSTLQESATLAARDVLGDWNFEPDDLPIDLINGQVHRPVSEVQGGYSALRPYCLLVASRPPLTRSPDHVAIVLRFQLDMVVQGNLGQCKYADVAVAYQVQRDPYLLAG